MKEEQKCKQCLYCDNYDGYYVKGLRRFESIQKGYCAHLEKIVDNRYGCEHWKSRRRRFLHRKKVASRALYKILMDISAIRQILQENQDEGKNL